MAFEPPSHPRTDDVSSRVARSQRIGRPVVAAALVLVLVYVVGGFANRVVVQVVFDTPSPSTSIQ